MTLNEYEILEQKVAVLGKIMEADTMNSQEIQEQVDDLATVLTNISSNMATMTNSQEQVDDLATGLTDTSSTVTFKRNVKDHDSQVELETKTTIYGTEFESALQTDGYNIGLELATNTPLNEIYEFSTEMSVDNASDFTIDTASIMGNVTDNISAGVIAIDPLDLEKFAAKITADFDNYSAELMLRSGELTATIGAEFENFKAEVETNGHNFDAELGFSNESGTEITLALETYNKQITDLTVAMEQQLNDSFAMFGEITHDTETSETGMTIGAQYDF